MQPLVLHTFGLLDMTFAVEAMLSERSNTPLCTTLNLGALTDGDTDGVAGAAAAAAAATLGEEVVGADFELEVCAAGGF
jgi:hypothetical protein